MTRSTAACLFWIVLVACGGSEREPIEFESSAPLSVLSTASQATLLAPAAASAGEPAGEQPGADEEQVADPVRRLFDQEFIDACYAEAVSALAEGPRIHLREDVPIVLLTAPEALERRKAFAAQLDQDGGMTMGMDMLADFVFSDAMLGRYLPDEKVIYIIEEVVDRHSGGDRDDAETLFFNVLVHELVHAYDDQVYGVMPTVTDIFAYVEEPERMPEMQALMSLFEGRATYAAELACDHAGRPMALPIPTVENAQRRNMARGNGDVASEMGAGMINIVARAKLVQYAYGREFAKQAFDFGGEKFFGEVFESLPISLAELEDFKRFKLRWAEQLAERIEAEEAEQEAQEQGLEDGPSGTGAVD